jgi:hypothetical protein
VVKVANREFGPEAELKIMIADLVKYRPRILARAHAITPDVRWDGRREKVEFIKQTLSGRPASVRRRGRLIRISAQIPNGWLVTGGCGLIGVNLARTLNQRIT